MTVGPGEVGSKYAVVHGVQVACMNACVGLLKVLFLR